MANVNEQLLELLRVASWKGFARYRFGTLVAGGTKERDKEGGKCGDPRSPGEARRRGRFMLFLMEAEREREKERKREPLNRSSITKNSDKLQKLSSPPERDIFHNCCVILHDTLGDICRQANSHR